MKKQLRISFLLLVSLQIRIAATAQSFTDSNLPIVVINTYGQFIDTAYQTFIVGMGIIDNGPGVRNHLTDPYNSYNGEVKIKLHGSSTLWLPKKSYGITLVDAFHNKMDASILGMPMESDWVMKAHYQDKTFMRDNISLMIAREMGHYASRTKYFELVVNGNYQGLYEMQEKVKRDAARVNIAKLKSYEISGVELTGGYIISLDKSTFGEAGWYSNYNSNVTHDSADYYLYVYPNPDSMPVQQKNYIKDYVDRYETAMVSPYFASPDSGYAKYINVASFIDNFILNEASRNVDGYRCSSFFYKEKDTDGDGKLHAGPAWDYNIAWDNCSYNGGHNPYSWQYQVYATGWYVPFWWWTLMSDDGFKDPLKCRYTELRQNVLSIPHLYSYIDSLAVYLDEAQQRNFTRWPIMGTAIYPEPTPVPGSYAGEVQVIKTWIQNRLTWLDNNMPGTCHVGIAETVAMENIMHVFPNPFVGDFNIVYELTYSAPVKLEIYDAVGQRVSELVNERQQPGTYQENMITGDLPAGIYFVNLTAGKKVYHQKVIKMK